MEQTTQQISQKPPFPIKTIIVGILMLLIGGAGFIFSIFIFYVVSNTNCTALAIPLSMAAVASIIFSIIFFVPGLLILLKKRLGWWLAIIIFSIITAIVIIAIIWTMYNIFWSTFTFHDIDDLLQCLIVIIPLIPLIILLIDRKNFFKIAP